PYLQHTLLTKSKEQLEQIYEVEEGLENRLLSQITISNSFQEFMSKIKTKRYTWTKLQRLCLHILTNTTKTEMYQAMEKEPYIRLLGMSQKGQQYLSSIKKDITIPIISNARSFSHPLFILDQKATAAYHTPLSNTSRLQAIRDEWNHIPIRV